MHAEGDWTQEGTPAVLAQAKRYIDAGRVDLSGIGRVDSAGVALLLELKRRAQAAGKTLQFVKAPAKLVTLATFFGVDAFLLEPQS